MSSGSSSASPGLESQGTFWVTGPCEIEGNCVSSTNYPKWYGKDEHCRITVIIGGDITVSDPFDIETGYDKVWYNGDDIRSKGDFPSTATTGDVINWKSDDWKTERGWKLCIETSSAESAVSEVAVAWRPAHGFDFHSGATKCYDDGVVGCWMRGRGDEGGCCGRNSVCLLAADGLQVCEDVVASGRLSRHGHRCDHRGNTVAERDAMCEGFNVCARKGRDGRKFGCDDYYCCIYPDAEYWANYKEPPCVPVPNWKDKYGNTCEWYEAGKERCQIYGESDWNDAPGFLPAMEQCCTCKEGDAGGLAANEGRTCSRYTEDSISHKWMVDLGASQTIYKDCWFFEQAGDRCRQSWGDVPGKDGLTANEVCCVCRFGNKCNEGFGRRFDNDGNQYDDSMDASEDYFSSIFFRVDRSQVFTRTDIGIYGFAMVGLIAVGRAAFLICTRKSTHNRIPDVEI